MDAPAPAALRPREFLAAVALAAVLTLGHVRFGQGLDDVAPLLGLYLLALIAAWYDGVRGGAVAVAAALAAFVFWPGLRAQIGLAGCALFLAAAGALVWIAAVLRRRHNRLRLQQEQWSTVLAGVGDGVALIGRDGRVLYLNPAGARLLGTSPEHARGLRAAEVFQDWPSALPDHAGPLPLRSVGDTPLQMESVPLQGPRDAFSGHAVFLRLPRGAEEGTSERRLRAVFDTDLWGVCFADIHGGRWWANPGFERMLAPADGSDTPMRARSLPQLGVPAELLQRLQRDGTFDPVEVALPDRGGDPAWMLLAGEALSERDIALLALDIGERKRSDAALRAQRLLMRALIDRIPALVAYVDTRRRYRLCNRAYRRWFDRRLQGLTLSDAHSAEAMAPYLPLLERAFAGQAVRFPVGLSWRGRQRHFDVQFVPHRSDGDGIEGVVIHALEVTERVEAARRVEASERRLRSLAVAGAGIVWYADAAGQLLDAPGWQELTGQAPAQADGDGWLAAVEPLDRERVRAAWSDSMRATAPELLDLEFRVATPLNQSRHVALRAVPVIDGNGRALEWIGSLHDVHERRLFEEQLRHAEAEQQALLDNMPNMVWIAEPDGSIRYQNRRWYEYTGLGGDQDWRDICHPDDLDNGLRSWDEAIRNGQPLHVELRFRRADDGQYRWHIVSGHPLLDADGRLRCWYGASTDIEDQKRALEMMAAANERISRFLAVLSHELRNPLSGVAAAGELLQRADLDPAQRERALATLVRQNLHLQRMVEDLLDVARVTQGGLELRQETLDLRGLLEEVRTDNLLRAEAAGVVFDPVEGEHYALVRGDRARLRQVFDNLVSNAIKASARGQRIDLSLRRTLARNRTTGLHVQVRDHGQGLDRDIAANLFEPFVQTSGWRSRGLGLGLSIVKSLVERHGGHVSARSDGPGRGACFDVQLPLAAPASTGRSEPSDAPVPATPVRRARVLIVDDEADTADALATLLGLEGHQVRVAGDGEQALSQWSQTVADVVLCDLDLPGPLDGHDVARTLRAMPQAPYLIAYSGYGLAEDRQRSREAGFDEHLTKPAPVERILEALQRGMGPR